MHLSTGHIRSSAFYTVNSLQERCSNVCGLWVAIKIGD